MSRSSIRGQLADIEMRATMLKKRAEMGEVPQREIIRTLDDIEYRVRAVHADFVQEEGK